MYGGKFYDEQKYKYSASTQKDEDKDRDKGEKMIFFSNGRICEKIGAGF